MLIDPRVERMAKVLVEYSLGVQPGWLVTISGSVAATPLIQAVYRHTLKVGAHPVVLMDAPEASDILLREGSDDQLTYIDPYRKHMVENSDAILRIMSEQNTRSTNDIDASRLALLRKGQAPIAA